jgi:hypothetical protein
MHLPGAIPEAGINKAVIFLIIFAAHTFKRHHENNATVKGSHHLHIILLHFFYGRSIVGAGHSESGFRELVGRRA